jgi:uncharacterized phage infection (PIP) family protein YhgE
MHFIILAAQTELGNKALDTIVQAIQAGMVGVAIILAAAIIIQAIASILSNRSSSKTTDELLKYNGRLATAIEKMDDTLDKLTEQQEEMGTLFAELTATLREIPTMFSKVMVEIGLMRKDFTEYAKLTDGTVGSLQNEMKDLVVVIDRRMGEINTKLQKLKPDTQPLPPISDPTPATLPEQPKPDLLEDKTKAGDTS